MYPLRAAIEGVAAREAASRVDAATLKKLEKLIGTMRAAAERNDGAAHAHADFSFHEAIIKAAGNRMLEHVWQSMRLATTTFVTHAMTQLTHRTLHEIGERHIPVLAALRARDPRLAEAEMRRHIEEPGDWIRHAVEAKRSEEPGERGREARG